MIPTLGIDDWYSIGMVWSYIVSGVVLSLWFTFAKDVSFGLSKPTPGPAVAVLMVGAILPLVWVATPILLIPFVLRPGAQRLRRRLEDRSQRAKDKSRLKTLEANSARLERMCEEKQHEIDRLLAPSDI